MKTRHYPEDDLVLFYYGEGRRPQVQAHLDACAECAARYREIASLLQMVATPRAPERGEHYGLEVWQRVRPVLPARPPARAYGWWMNRLVLGGAAAAVILLAFFVGRSWQSSSVPNTVAVNLNQPVDTAARVRLAAIGDHLERSERLLLDFVNADGPDMDISAATAMAGNLIVANRLYREAAEAAGDDLTADVLDALGRSLIEIAHAPATVAPGEFSSTRVRLDAAALIFKVRVLADELHQQERLTPPFRKDA